MNILTIIIVGLSGMVAQILLLRELLVSFSGNELTIGIIFANWVIAEAAGVFLIGRLVDKIEKKVNVFIILQLLFSLSLPASLYLARTFKVLLGFTAGEAIGLNLIYLCSLLIILPVGFCHGALFGTCSKLYALNTSESASAIGKVYTWEMLGTLLGGVFLTYLFIPYLNSFQIVFAISLMNVALIIFFLRSAAHIALKFFSVVILGLMIFLGLTGGLKHLQQESVKTQWRNNDVLSYRNSIYGNVVVTREEEQYTFFYNGQPVITTPFPDVTFAEEFGNIPLLFHPSPEKVLIISAGAGGLINEVLKHQVRSIDYAEIDPTIINMLKIYRTKLSERELTDKRVRIVNLDGSFYLKKSQARYDFILIGISSQSDLSTNRLFTEEFFTLAKKRLNQEGIIAFWMPGSLTYLSQELRDLNACILNSLKEAFPYVRVIPGDYNIYLASSSGELMKITPVTLSQRIDARRIKNNFLVPNYLKYRLDSKWSNWFSKELSQATKAKNLDYSPMAVYQMLLFWNKKFSPEFFLFLNVLKKLNLKIVSILILMLSALVFYFAGRFKKKRAAVIFSIAATGFYGMLMSLILVFAFQVFFGYLYYSIAILVTIFMTGSSLGAMLITKKMEKIKNPPRFFMLLESLVVIFSFLTAFLITRSLPGASFAYFIFICLFLISGLLLGLQFPLAAKLYLGDKKGVGETAGALYSADLIGGWAAGAIGGVVLLPVLGLFGACMVMVILKLSTLMVFSLIYKNN